MRGVAAAPNGPISLDVFVSKILFALEQNWGARRTVVHYFLPAFARRDSEESEQRIGERLEIGVEIQTAVQFHFCKKVSTQNGEQKEEEKQECANVEQFGDGKHESLNNLL